VLVISYTLALILHHHDQTLQLPSGPRRWWEHFWHAQPLPGPTEPQLGMAEATEDFYFSAVSRHINVKTKQKRILSKRPKGGGPL
jgi:hypothetical protein